MNNTDLKIKLDELIAEKNIFQKAYQIQQNIESTKRIVLENEKLAKTTLEANSRKNFLQLAKDASARLHTLAINRNLTLGATTHNNESEVDKEIEEINKLLNA